MAESQIIHTPDSTGAGVRTISVTTLINGVPTTVQMQVMALADESGNVIRDFASYNLQLAQLAELRAIRRILATVNNIFDTVQDGTAVGIQQQ
jgi:hypothetical protein